MLMPSIFGENLFDEFFGDWDREMRRMDRKLYGRNAAREMKTDVHEHEDHYEVDIDLPGFKKEDITLELQNGYLTVTRRRASIKTRPQRRAKSSGRSAGLVRCREASMWATHLPKLTSAQSWSTAYLA